MPYQIASHLGQSTLIAVIDLPSPQRSIVLYDVLSEWATHLGPTKSVTAVCVSQQAANAALAAQHSPVILTNDHLANVAALRCADVDLVSFDAIDTANEVVAAGELLASTPYGLACAVATPALLRDVLRRAGRSPDATGAYADVWVLSPAGAITLQRFV